MSNVLVHLGGAQWVAPEDIVAIEWNTALMNECPRIILRNGHRLNATHFDRASTIESAEDATGRLLQHISRKLAEQHMHPRPAAGRLS